MFRPYFLSQKSYETIIFFILVQFNATANCFFHIVEEFLALERFPQKIQKAVVV